MNYLNKIMKYLCMLNIIRRSFDIIHFGMKNHDVENIN